MVSSMNEPFVSPRLATLQRELEAGGSAPLARFWERMAHEGTPLIEAIEGDGHHRLVTFLWRGADDDMRVEVLSALGEQGAPSSTAMLRLNGTAVWHKTYRARADLRSQYLFRVTGPHGTARRHDLLNAHPWVVDRNGADPGYAAMLTEQWTLSTVELPDAPAVPWLASQPGVPAGTTESYRVPSTALGEERRVWVYTPHAATAGNRPAGVLILFDGWVYARVYGASTILDNLIAARRVPPLVAVMVDNPPALRGHELRAVGSFEAFVTHELLPWVRERFQVTTNPAAVVAGGASAGGLAAATLALRHPDLIGNVLAQSGGFWWSPDDDPEAEWFSRQVAAQPLVPVRFYLNVGLLETAPTAGGRPSRLVAVRHLRTVLKARGYEVQYAEFMGGHDNLCWRATLPDGLLALVGRRPVAEGPEATSGDQPMTGYERGREG